MELLACSATRIEHMQVRRGRGGEGEGRGRSEEGEKREG